MIRKMRKCKTSQGGMEQSGTEPISHSVNQMVGLTRRFRRQGAWEKWEIAHTDTKKDSWKTSKRS